MTKGMDLYEHGYTGSVQSQELFHQIDALTHGDDM